MITAKESTAPVYGGRRGAPGAFRSTSVYGLAMHGLRIRPGTSVVAAALSFVLFAAAAAWLPATSSAMRTTGMYDKRYCEYLFIHADASGFYADVWNTYGLNSCPERLWKASNTAALSTEMGALFVKLNGPRHWLIDRAKITYDPSAEMKQGVVRSFSGLKMRRLTTGAVPTVNGRPGLPAYTETTVNRTTFFTFSRRNPLRVLVAPSGARYAMQAYSQIKDPTMSEKRLASLGSRLSLPAGWRYEVRRIKKDLTLKTVARTTVIQDEFENTYQLIG